MDEPLIDDSDRRREENSGIEGAIQVMYDYRNIQGKRGAITQMT